MEVARQKRCASMWAGDIKRPLANQVNGARGLSPLPRAGLICSTWRGIVREERRRRASLSRRDATRRRGDRRGGKREKWRIRLINPLPTLSLPPSPASPSHSFALLASSSHRARTRCLDRLIALDQCTRREYLRRDISWSRS